MTSSFFAPKPAQPAEDVCPGFVPLETAYKPIGLLYRRMARERCLHCGLLRAEHSDGSPHGNV